MHLWKLVETFVNKASYIFFRGNKRTSARRSVNMLAIKWLNGISLSSAQEELRNGIVPMPQLPSNSFMPPKHRSKTKLILPKYLVNSGLFYDTR